MPHITSIIDRYFQRNSRVELDKDLIYVLVLR